VAGIIAKGDAMKKIGVIFSFVLAFGLLSTHAYSTERDKNKPGSPTSELIKSKKQAVTVTPSLPDLFQRVSPSVVMILASESGSVIEKTGEKFVVLDLGSGVVISKDGFVMTAAKSVHVADAVNVKFLDGRLIPAEVVASSDLADVALIKLKDVPADLVVATLGDSDKVRVGEKVFVVCASCGEEHTLAVRHISGRRKSEALSDLLIPLEFLQTDGVINEEYNGGTMFNMNGEVVGIVSTILSDTTNLTKQGLLPASITQKSCSLRGNRFGPVWMFFYSRAL
jgi:S1-C subfamily serine protease